MQDLKIKPREPKLPKAPNSIGRPLGRISNEAYHGKFERIRLQLRPEDVLGQAGSAFSDAGVVTRKKGRR